MMLPEDPNIQPSIVKDTSPKPSCYSTNIQFVSDNSQNSAGDICRICHCESDAQQLLTPCLCSGSLKYVHQACLQQWLIASGSNICELCKFPFIVQSKLKPFKEWRGLEISGLERRRILCSMLFHGAAALCVIWSLCVLIERAADDVQRGLIDWPFWTKLVVVAIGLAGGFIFMFIQCKSYLDLCHRWKARNRILFIHNAPEALQKPLLKSPTATGPGSVAATVEQQPASKESSDEYPNAPNIQDSGGFAELPSNQYSH